MASKKFQTGQQTSPKITTGGASNSEVLNEYFQSMTEDLLALTMDVDNLAEVVSSLNKFSIIQNDALASLFANIETTVEGLTSGSTDSLIVPMSSSQNVTNATTATQFKWANQATLPIKQSTDLIKYTDVYGNDYVPVDIKLKYGYSDGTELPDFVEHAHSNKVLLGNSPLILDWPEGRTVDNTTFFFKLEIPIELQNNPANIFEIGLLPHTQCKVVKLGYSTNLNTLLDDLIDIDFSYVPGYNPTVYGNNYINQATKIRVHLPQTDIRCIVVGIKMDTISFVGCNAVKLLSNEYELSADLVVQNPYGNIESVYLRGKDENELALIPSAINTNTATFSLSSTNAFLTPVVTSVIITTS